MGYEKGAKKLKIHKESRTQLKCVTSGVTPAPGGAEVGAPLVGLEQVGVVPDEVDRGGELHRRAHRPGRADLGDGQLGQLVEVLDECLVQLTEATDAERVVGAPVGLVERPSRGAHRAAQRLLRSARKCK